MSLFDHKDLFHSGTRGTRYFDVPDATLSLTDAFFSKEDSDRFYDTLLAETPWRDFAMEINSKSILVPRQISWYEDKTNFGALPDGLDWTPTLLEIRRKVESLTGHAFNSALLNLYRDGNDGVSWHSDREHTIGQDPVIASVSFGQTRLFRLRHKFRKDVPQLEIPLFHGTLLVMAGRTNSFWQHQAPKTSKNVLPRINLTFRMAKRI